MVVELWGNPKIGEGQSLAKGPLEGMPARRAHRTCAAGKCGGVGEGGSPHRLQERVSAAPATGQYGGTKLTPEFAHAAYEISGRRGVMAGYRMAALLHELFGGHK